MDIDDVAAFLRIADLKSVSAAARALGAPKSSISRSLARLEQRAGAELIRRSTRRVTLTDAGYIFYQHALRIISDVHEAENALKGLTGVAQGVLHVSAAFAFVQEIIAPMLPAFLRDHPELCVLLDADDRQHTVLPNLADVVINRGLIPESALVARTLPSVDIWLCASPNYLRAHGIPASVDDLRSHDVIDRTAATEWTFLRNGRSSIFSCRARAVIPDAAAQKVVLVGGFGIGRLPNYVAQPAISSGQLVRVLAEYEIKTVELTAIYASYRGLSARARVFIDALAKHMTSHQSSSGD